MDSETFGPFGLYYHMMNTVKMAGRDAETDLASVFRNSQGEWFPEATTASEYF